MLPKGATIQDVQMMQQRLAGISALCGVHILKPYWNKNGSPARTRPSNPVQVLSVLFYATVKSSVRGGPPQSHLSVHESLQFLPKFAPAAIAAVHEGVGESSR